MTGDSIEGEWNGFIFRKVKPEDHKNILENVKTHLLSSMKTVGYQEKLESDWMMLFKDVLEEEDNLSIIALDKDTGEIAGFRIIGIFKTGVGAEEITPPLKHEETRIMFHCTVDLHKKGRVDEHTDKEYYADFFGVVVVPKFRNRGLCTELYKRAIEICKSRGLDMARVVFISPFSRKAGRRNGYKELSRMLCIEIAYENGVPLNPEVDPKWYLDMGVFKF